MTTRDALDAAVSTFLNPIFAAHLRDERLPTGMGLVLRIAAGDGEAIAQGIALREIEPERLISAVRFYLEQVVLVPQADDLRLFGVSAAASPEELRDNRRWLLKWLHPDRNGGEWEREQFVRICAAWDRIEHHVATTGSAGATVPVVRVDRSNHRTGGFDPRRDRGHHRPRRGRRVLLWLAGAALVAGLLVGTVWLDDLVATRVCPDGWAQWVPMCFDASGRR